MSESRWYKVAKLIVRISGNPLIQANENLVELLQFLLNEEQVTFLLNFRKPILTFQELKERTSMSDTNLTYILNSLMDNGIIVDIPNKVTGVMEYRLQAPIPDIFEYSLVQKRSWEEKQKLAHIYEKIMKGASELTQNNYDSLISIFKERMPIFTRIIPIEKEIKIPQEKTLPLHEASKIIDQQEIISVSECPCKLNKTLLGDPCKTTTERFRCFHFGNLGRYFIEHGFGKPISKSEAKKLLRDAEEDGLVHKTFHDDFDIHNNENSICNCCKCCCIIFQSYYRGIFPFHTRTSYIAKINESKCTGSGTCIDKCPLEANSLINGKVHLDELKCIGCGICVHHCPEHARSLEKTVLRTVFIQPPKLENLNHV